MPASAGSWVLVGTTWKRRGRVDRPAPSGILPTLVTSTTLTTSPTRKTKG